jgi:hypothetical protein
MFQSQKRFYTFFAGVYSQLIAFAQEQKNNGVFQSAITPNLELEAQALLRKEPTEKLFLVAAKTDLSLHSVSFSDALSIQDVLINTVAAILANDVADFSGLDVQWKVKENAIDSYSERVSAKGIRLPRGDGDNISDAQRDALSGADIDLTQIRADDNDCGDSCKV